MMNRETMYKLWLLVSVILVQAMFVACGSDDPVKEPEPEPELTINQKVNKFSVGAMKMLYLWNKEIPSTIKADSDEEPIEYFKKMMHANDGWSYLENKALTRVSESDIDEVTTGFGFHLWPVRIDGNDVIFFVQYVNPESPAEKAGLKRGDILLTVDGKFYNMDTYQQINSITSAKIELGELTEAGLKYADKTVNLQIEKQYFDVVIHSEIINEHVPGEPKIGYLCYTGYKYASKEKLKGVFSEFKTKGVSEMILDLRYNPGGYTEVSRYICSILAPYDHVVKKDVYLYEHWNDDFMAELTKEETTQRFMSDVAGENLRLSRIYVLTSESTASASEATIVGLKPYMKVVQIGEKTHGKFCGAIACTPSYYYVNLEQGKASDAEGIGDWEANIMIYKFANVNGESPVGGLAPDEKYEMGDVYDPKTNSLDLSFKPFGSKEDKMVAAAIADIKGVSVARTKTRSTAFTNRMELLPMPEQEGGMIVRKQDLPASIINSQQSR